MARRLARNVPEGVRRLLEAELEGQLGVTFLVMTAGETGWPHLALVSVGELMILAEDRLALALWPASTSAANLSRGARVTLALVADGRVFSLRCEVEREAVVRVDGEPALSGFGLRVTEAFEDVAPYADLLAGITYRLHDPSATIARWSATREALRASFGLRGSCRSASRTRDTE